MTFSSTSLFLFYLVFCAENGGDPDFALRMWMKHGQTRILFVFFSLSAQWQVEWIVGLDELNPGMIHMYRRTFCWKRERQGGGFPFMALQSSTLKVLLFISFFLLNYIGLGKLRTRWWWTLSTEIRILETYSLNFRMRLGLQFSKVAAKYLNFWENNPSTRMPFPSIRGHGLQAELFEGRKSSGSKLKLIN